MMKDTIFYNRITDEVFQQSSYGYLEIKGFHKISNGVDTKGYFDISTDSYIIEKTITYNGVHLMLNHSINRKEVRNGIWVMMTKMIENPIYRCGRSSTVEFAKRDIQTMDGLINIMVNEEEASRSWIYEKE